MMTTEAIVRYREDGKHSLWTFSDKSEPDPDFYCSVAEYEEIKEYGTVDITIIFDENDESFERTKEKLSL